MVNKLQAPSVFLSSGNVEQMSLYVLDQQVVLCNNERLQVIDPHVSCERV